MLDKKEFNNLRAELENFDKQRELLIKKARDILRLSKLIIYSVHRNELDAASKQIESIIKEKKELDKIASHDCDLIYEGSYIAAMQEYVEALCFFEFVKNNTIPSKQKLNVSTEEYLLGICDLTGELTRRAVVSAIDNFDEVTRIKALVEQIFGEFLKFDFRNGALRQKADSIKWNLKKIEEVIYDINIRK